MSAIYHCLNDGHIRKIYSMVKLKFLTIFDSAKMWKQYKRRKRKSANNARSKVQMRTKQITFLEFLGNKVRSEFLGCGLQYCGILIGRCECRFNEAIFAYHQHIFLSYCAAIPRAFEQMSDHTSKSQPPKPHRFTRLTFSDKQVAISKENYIPFVLSARLLSHFLFYSIPFNFNTLIHPISPAMNNAKSEKSFVIAQNF